MSTVTRKIETQCEHLIRARLTSAHLHASGSLLCDYCEEKFHLVYPEEVSVQLVLVNSKWMSLKSLAGLERVTRKVAELLLVLLLAPLVVRPQVVQLTGGDSGLYQAEGGGVSVFYPNFTTELSGGLSNGRPAIGVATRFTYKGWDTSLGDSSFNSVIGNSGLFLNVRGVTIERKDITLFAGSVEPRLGPSFFQGTRSGLRGGGGAAWHHDFHTGWKLSSLAVSSGAKRTFLADGGYHHGGWDLGGGGGRLENHTLTQGTLAYHWDGHFALVTNYLKTQGSTFITAMGALGLGPLNLTASDIRGTRHGQVYGGGLRLGPVDVGANYMRFTGSSNLGLNIGQRFGRYLVVREYASRSAGRWNESLGGGFQTNRFSVDVSHQFFVVPYGNAPLRQAVVVTLHLRLPWKSVSVNLASGLTPDGRWRFGGDGSTFIGSGFGSPEHSSSYRAGKYLISGTVTDEQGQPVIGVAIRLAKKDLVFSDSTGQFWLRVKKDKPLPLAVVPAEFPAPGCWAVVTAPEQAVPGSPVHIVVRRGRP
jgi:hypothetical protein